jgi:23S rRNA (adenine1618-N6)-methyltransferase
MLLSWILLRMIIRWEYVKWIQGLLDSTSPTYTDGYDSSKEVAGIDMFVYTNLSCFYLTMRAAV